MAAEPGGERMTRARPCCASEVRDRNGSDDVDQIGLVSRIKSEVNAPDVRRTSFFPYLLD
jgi:hypothetical protein